MKIILHVVNSLNKGGAETFLCRLIINDAVNKHVVISLLKGGELENDLIIHKKEVYSLNFNNLYNSIFYFFKLIFYILIIKPDIVQTWLYHSDLIGGLAAKICNVNQIIWTVRTSLQNDSEYKITTRIIKFINSKLSYIIPNKIIYCSKRIYNEHLEFGYKKRQAFIVYNGVNTQKFRKRIKQDKDFLAEFFEKKQLRFVMISNFIRQKDHLNLLKAINLLKSKDLNFKVIFVGNNFDQNGSYLNEYIVKNKINKFVSIYGYCDHVDELVRLFDYLILSSKSEGFPNVLIEAMASGVPCISTDVGDSAEIIGKTGWICPPQDYYSMASCLCEAIKENKKDYHVRSIECIKRVKNNYEIRNSVKNYLDIYHEYI